MLEQIRLALMERGIEHSGSAGELRIHYGSAEVQIQILDSPPTPTVTLRAPVLVDVTVVDNESELLVLRMLNERNARLRFGKFYFDQSRSRIVVEYEILGSHMQPE